MADCGGNGGAAAAQLASCVELQRKSAVVVMIGDGPENAETAWWIADRGRGG